MIKNIFINNINALDDKTKNKLVEAGYNTIGDLISRKSSDISFLFTDRHTFNLICDIIHIDFSLFFQGEYNYIDEQNETIENTTIRSLPLSNNVKNALIRGGIKTLSDLLTTDYYDIEKINYIGELHLSQIKEYVHSLGYTLRSEITTINEKKEILRKEGKKIIEDDFYDPLIYCTLYKNNIFTIEDIINYGPNIFRLGGVGDKRKEELARRLKELNIPLWDDNYVLPIKNENNEIENKINKKKSLLEEYYELLKENKELKMEDEKLNLLLNQIEEVLNSGRK